jgi:hypothetical protein
MSPGKRYFERKIPLLNKGRFDYRGEIAQAAARQAPRNYWRESIADLPAQGKRIVLHKIIALEGRIQGQPAHWRLSAIIEKKHFAIAEGRLFRFQTRSMRKT